VTFFAPSSFAGKGKPISLPQCGACNLWRGCKSPKMPFSGPGNIPMLIVGEAPGETEDELGRQFVGKAGQCLRQLCDEAGFDLADCWLTNAAICRPEANKLEDQVIGYCRPNLLNTIAQLRPKVIVLLGGSAVESLIGSEWGGDVGPVSRWAGYTIPSSKYSCWICPTYHPSFVERSNRDPLLWKTVRGHLAQAYKLAKAPGNAPCLSLDALKARVEVITDPRQAKRFDLVGREGILAFDYETTGLKPERPEQRIVCVSFCLNGEDTWACMIEPRLHKYLSAVLLNPNLRKVASNLKFEERWTRQKLGHGVANWHWDTMLAAHYLDNRPGITSVKFQAYVYLGIGEYDHWVDEEKKADGANDLNRMGEANVQDMLTYCALDSLIEYLVMEQQKELMGVR
jgi:uracil-DNA glycosylase